MVDGDAVWRALARGADPAALGVDRVEGRWDLRGVGAPVTSWSRKGANPTLRGVRLCGLSLAGSDLPHFRLVDCRLEDCVLDGAALFDWRMWGTDVRDCSFVAASLRDAGMGGDRRSPNSWTNVDFRRADLRGTAHFAESYTDCGFQDAQLDRVDFDGSRHVGSAFAGDVREVEFRSRPRGARRARSVNRMAGVDFGNADVQSAAFHDLDLSACLLPRSPHHLVFADRRLFALRVLAALDVSATELVDLRVQMQGHVAEAPPGPGGPGFEHRADLGGTESEIDEAVDLMRSLGAR